MSYSSSSGWRYASTLIQWSVVQGWCTHLTYLPHAPAEQVKVIWVILPWQASQRRWQTATSLCADFLPSNFVSHAWYFEGQNLDYVVISSLEKRLHCPLQAFVGHQAEIGNVAGKVDEGGGAILHHFWNRPFLCACPQWHHLVASALQTLQTLGHTLLLSTFPFFLILFCTFYNWMLLMLYSFKKYSLLSKWV